MTGVLDYNRLYGATPSDSRHRELSLGSVVGVPLTRRPRLTGAPIHGVEGRWSEADTHQMRLRIPLQNVMWGRRGIDSIENSVDEALGIKPRNFGAPVTP